MPNEQHKLIYEFSGNRNLSTNPLDVTGLDGDAWDYMVEMTQLDTGVGSGNVTFNNDTTANYRRYNMRGQGAGASAGVTDTRSDILILDVANESPNVLRGVITGESGVERYFNYTFASDHASSDPRLYVNSAYWKNTVDNLESIQFNGGNFTSDITLRIYQVPKQANLDNYDLVDVVDFTSRDLNANPIVFSGLDGDSDGEYLIEFKGEGNSASSPNLPQILYRMNGDSTASNYTTQWLKNQGGGIGAVNNSTYAGYFPSFDTFRDADTEFDTRVTINAKSGRKRFLTASSSKNTTVQQAESSCWYSDTASNLTSIEVFGSLPGIITGTFKLYKRKSNRTIDPVPMRTVVEHDIAGVDFSAGITISGIEGDRIDGPIKVEFVGSSAGSDELQIQFNGDTGANYPRQSLYASTSSALAASGTEQNIPFGVTIDSDTASATAWIYPNSGQNRPVLVECEANLTFLWRMAHWWNNSVDEITSMKIFTDTTSLLTGKIRISVPKNTKQASPSFIKTVN